jgi:hypothetical protein
MNAGQVEVVIVLPFLLLGVALVVAFAWVPEPPEAGGPPTGQVPKRGLRRRVADVVGLVGSWFVLTVLTIWCGAIVAFLVLHGLLFTFGQGAASVGLFVTVLLLELAPFGWALVMLRRARRSALGRKNDEQQHS